jgi:hypothetical protein
LYSIIGNMTKRKLPPHVVLPDGRWRFVKKGSKKIISRGRKIMAKKKKSSGGGGRGRSLLGGLGSFAPGIAGAAENIVNNYIPVPGLGTFGAGWLLNDTWSKNQGMYQIGYYFGGMLPSFGGGGSTSAGGML